LLPTKLNWYTKESRRGREKLEKSGKVKREKAYEYSLEGCLVNVIFDFRVAKTLESIAVIR
jgi:hypothetical protein